MTNTDILNTSLYLVKQASPAWSRLFNQLSEASRTRIISSIPPNMVRSVGKKPLGVGAEGMVFPSVTGGRGESAVKVFYDRLSGKSITPNETVNPNFKRNIDKRIELLSSYPSIFPEIHAAHPRGWVMERLHPVRNREPVNWQTPLNQLRTSKELLKYYRRQRDLSLPTQANTTLFERIRSFLKPKLSDTAQHYDKLISNSESRVKDIWQNRHAPIPYHPMSDLARRVSKVAPHKQDHRDILTSPLKGVTLPLRSGPVRISDFGATVNGNYPIVTPSGSTRPGLEYHNIMQRANGQPVISDPLLKQASKLSEMLRIRRSLPVFNAAVKGSEDKLVSHMFNTVPGTAVHTSIARDIKPSFYDPISKAVYTTPSSKRHELIHAYQDQLPGKYSSPFIRMSRMPVLKDYIQSPVQEVGARAGQYNAAFRASQPAPTLHAAHLTMYQSPHYVGKTGGKIWPLLNYIRSKIPLLSDFDRVDTHAGVGHYLKNIFK